TQLTAKQKIPKQKKEASEQRQRCGECRSKNSPSEYFDENDIKNDISNRCDNHGCHRETCAMLCTDDAVRHRAHGLKRRRKQYRIKEFPRRFENFSFGSEQTEDFVWK